jgi:hypothetical protein
MAVLSLSVGFKKQVPCGDDNQNGNSNGKGKRGERGGRGEFATALVVGRG